MTTGLIPEGTYRGKLVKLGPIQKSKEKGTLYWNVECVITEEGEWKGKRVFWSAFLTPDTRVRTYEAFVASGCTFPNKDSSNFEGFGTEEVDLVIGQDTPPATEKFPNPKPYNVVNFVNRPRRGKPGIPVEESEAKAILGSDDMKAALAAALEGNRQAGQDTGPVDPKTGKKMF